MSKSERRRAKAYKFATIRNNSLCYFPYTAKFVWDFSLPIFSFLARECNVREQSALQDLKRCNIDIVFAVAIAISNWLHRFSFVWKHFSPPVVAACFTNSNCFRFQVFAHFVEPFATKSTNRTDKEHTYTFSFVSFVWFYFSSSLNAAFLRHSFNFVIFIL